MPENMSHSSINATPNSDQPGINYPGDTNQTGSNAPDAIIQKGSNAPGDRVGATSGHTERRVREYQGNITSKEAGNMVKNMIREQEKVLMETYEKNNKMK